MGMQPPDYGPTWNAVRDAVIFLGTGGSNWPEADEDQIQALHDAFSTFTGGLAAGISATRAAAADVTTLWSGDSGHTFADTWNTFGIDVPQQLFDIITGPGGVLDSLNQARLDVEYDKISTTIEVSVLILEMFVWAIALLIGFWVAFAAAAARIGATRLTVTALMHELVAAAGSSFARQGLSGGIRAALRSWAGHLPRNIANEMAAELGIDGTTQILTGDLRLDRLAAAGLGGAAGAVLSVGTPIGRDLANRTNNRLARQAGRIGTDAADEIITELGAETLANGTVYGQWQINTNNLAARTAAGMARDHVSHGADLTNRIETTLRNTLNPTPAITNLATTSTQNAAVARQAAAQATQAAAQARASAGTPTARTGPTTTTGGAGAGGTTGGGTGGATGRAAGAGTTANGQTSTADAAARAERSAQAAARAAAAAEAAAQEAERQAEAAAQASTVAQARQAAQQAAAATTEALRQAAVATAHANPGNLVTTDPSTLPTTTPAPVVTTLPTPVRPEDLGLAAGLPTTDPTAATPAPAPANAGTGTPPTGAAPSTSADPSTSASPSTATGPSTSAGPATTAAGTPAPGSTMPPTTAPSTTAPSTTAQPAAGQGTPGQNAPGQNATGQGSAGSGTAGQNTDARATGQPGGDAQTGGTRSGDQRQSGDPAASGDQQATPDAAASDTGTSDTATTTTSDTANPDTATPGTDPSGTTEAPSADAAVVAPRPEILLGQGVRARDLDLDGFDPASPADQRRLAAAVPRDPDGRPTVHPDPLGLWPSLINDGGNSVAGRATNCVPSAQAFLSTWFGDPHVAAFATTNDDGVATRALVDWLGGSFYVGGQGRAGLQRVTDDLVDAQHGAAAVITTPLAGDSVFHVTVAVNYHGTVYWFDVQNFTFPHVEHHHANYVGEVRVLLLDGTGAPTGPSTQTEDGQTRDGQSQDEIHGSLPPATTAERAQAQSRTAAVLAAAAQPGLDPATRAQVVTAAARLATLAADARTPSAALTRAAGELEVTIAAAAGLAEAADAHVTADRALDARLAFTADDAAAITAAAQQLADAQATLLDPALLARAADPAVTADPAAIAGIVAELGGRAQAVADARTTMGAVLDAVAAARAELSQARSAVAAAPATANPAAGVPRTTSQAVNQGVTDIGDATTTLDGLLAAATSAADLTAATAALAAARSRLSTAQTAWAAVLATPTGAWHADLTAGLQQQESADAAASSIAALILAIGDLRADLDLTALVLNRLENTVLPAARTAAADPSAATLDALLAAVDGLPARFGRRLSLATQAHLRDAQELALVSGIVAGAFAGIPARPGSPLATLAAYAQRAAGETTDLMAADRLAAPTSRRDRDRRLNALQVLAEQIAAARAEQRALVTLAAIIHHELTQARLAGAQLDAAADRLLDRMGLPQDGTLPPHFAALRADAEQGLQDATTALLDLLANPDSDALADAASTMARQREAVTATAADLTAVAVTLQEARATATAMTDAATTIDQGLPEATLPPRSGHTAAADRRQTAAAALADDADALRSRATDLTDTANAVAAALADPDENVRAQNLRDLRTATAEQQAYAHQVADASAQAALDADVAALAQAGDAVLQATIAQARTAFSLDWADVEVDGTTLTIHPHGRFRPSFTLQIRFAALDSGTLTRLAARTTPDSTAPDAVLEVSTALAGHPQLARLLADLVPQAAVDVRHLRRRRRRGRLDGEAKPTKIMPISAADRARLARLRIATRPDRQRALQGTLTAQQLQTQHVQLREEVAVAQNAAVVRALADLGVLTDQNLRSTSNESGVRRRSLRRRLDGFSATTRAQIVARILDTRSAPDPAKVAARLTRAAAAYTRGESSLLAGVMIVRDGGSLRLRVALPPATAGQAATIVDVDIEISESTPPAAVRLDRSGQTPVLRVRADASDLALDVEVPAALAEIATHVGITASSSTDAALVAVAGVRAHLAALDDALLRTSDPLLREAMQNALGTLANRLTPHRDSGLPEVQQVLDAIADSQGRHTRRLLRAGRTVRLRQKLWGPPDAATVSVLFHLGRRGATATAAAIFAFTTNPLAGRSTEQSLMSTLRSGVRDPVQGMSDKNAAATVAAQGDPPKLHQQGSRPGEGVWQPGTNPDRTENWQKRLPGATAGGIASQIGVWTGKPQDVDGERLGQLLIGGELLAGEVIASGFGQAEVDFRQDPLERQADARAKHETNQAPDTRRNSATKSLVHVVQALRARIGEADSLTPDERAKLRTALDTLRRDLLDARLAMREEVGHKVAEMRWRRRRVNPFRRGGRRPVAQTPDGTAVTYTLRGRGFSDAAPRAGHNAVRVAAQQALTGMQSLLLQTIISVLKVYKPMAMTFTGMIAASNVGWGWAYGLNWSNLKPEELADAQAVEAWDAHNDVDATLRELDTLAQRLSGEASPRLPGSRERLSTRLVRAVTRGHLRDTALQRLADREAGRPNAVYWVSQVVTKHGWSSVTRIVAYTATGAVIATIFGAPLALVSALGVGATLVQTALAFGETPMRVWGAAFKRANEQRALADAARTQPVTLAALAEQARALGTDVHEASRSIQPAPDTPLPRPGHRAGARQVGRDIRHAVTGPARIGSHGRAPALRRGPSASGRIRLSAADRAALDTLFLRTVDVARGQTLQRNGAPVPPALDPTRVLAAALSELAHLGLLASDVDADRRWQAAQRYLRGRYAADVSTLEALRQLSLDDPAVDPADVPLLATLAETLHRDALRAAIVAELERLAHEGVLSRRRMIEFVAADRLRITAGRRRVEVTIAVGPLPAGETSRLEPATGRGGRPHLILAPHVLTNPALLRQALAGASPLALP